MALLSIANLVLSIGERRLLDGVSLSIDEGQHVGLVGRNGCGKSTLMKLVAGASPLRPEGGHVQLVRGATAGYLTQEPNLDPERTLRDEASAAFAGLHRLHEKLEDVAHRMASAEGDELEKLLRQYEKVERKMEAAGGYAVEHRIDATLHGLGLSEEFFSVRVADLSGGQKGRLALAKLLLGDPDLLLLDEPTNHLDIAGRQWLEEYLASYRGAVILVSHDRWLLDRVASKIYELERGTLVEYPGNYRAYREQREQHRLAQRRRYEKQREKIRNEQAFIDRYRAGQRAAQAQGRAKKLERFKRDEAIDPVVMEREAELDIPPAPRCGDLVITADGIGKGYEGKTLFRGLSMVVQRGERIGIIGPNGAGKSTLIRTLLGEQAADEGTARVGDSVSVGHYHQSHEGLNPDETVVEYLRRFVGGAEQAARDLAGAFLFSGGEQDKPLGVLSGGERSRAALAGLFVGEHNLLVLDEPTNHLDIPSAERLEAALKRYTAEPSGYGQKTSGGGTLLLITHDRMLLEDVVDQLLILDGHGNVRHFRGTWSEYQEAERERPGPSKTQVRPGERGNQKSKRSSPPKTQGRAAKHEDRKPKAGNRKSHRGGSSVSKLNQEALERRIVQIEARLAEVDQALADPEAYSDGQKIKRLQARRGELGGELGPLEEEWTRRAEV